MIQTVYREIARARGTLRRFVGGSAVTRVAVVVFVIFVLVAVFAPLIAPYPQDAIGAVHPADGLASPSLRHLMGTDELGRDIFSMVVIGSRISIGISFLTILIALAIGVSLGLIAGYVGGGVDEGIMRFTDIVLAFPSLLLAVAIAATLGPSLSHAAIAIALSWWPWYTRLIRNQVVNLRSADFIQAASLSGLRRSAVLVKHVLPNALTPVVVQASMDLGSVLLTLAGLDFLGLGAQPPTPEWGLLVSDAQNYALTSWWYITFPGLAILLSTSAMNLMGDALNDLLNPRERGVL